MSKGRFQTDCLIDLTLGNIGGSSESKLTVDEPPDDTYDKTKGYRIDTVVNLSTNNQEYICIDDEEGNAQWAYIVSSEDHLNNIGQTDRKVFVQENQTLWEFNSTAGEWFLVDNNLHKRGLMQIDEVWSRPYNKIPDGYVQFVYGLIVPDGTTLEVDGELIDLKERIQNGSKNR